MKTPGKRSDRKRTSTEAVSSVTAIFDERKAMNRVLRRAVRDALRVHKRLGHSIVVWSKGRVQVLPASRIPVD